MSVSRVNLSNATSVGIYLRHIQHDEVLPAENTKYLKQIIEGRAVREGSRFLDCALQDLREKIIATDRHGVKNLLQILMAEGMTLEDIRDAVSD